MSLKADFVSGTQWEDFTLLLRSDGFLRTSGGGSGRAYQVTFQGTPPSIQTFPCITLRRDDYDTGTHDILFRQGWTSSHDPMNIVVSLSGGNIKLWVDSNPVFDITDPNPLLYGGIGVHAIWEAEARFDDVLVTTEPIPEPSTLFLFGVGFLGLVGYVYRRKRRK
jgi:hypothetical protein